MWTPRFLYPFRTVNNAAGNIGFSLRSRCQLFWVNTQQRIGGSCGIHTFEAAAELCSGGQSVLETRGLGSSLPRPVTSLGVAFCPCPIRGTMRPPSSRLLGQSPKRGQCGGIQHDVLCSLLHLARPGAKLLTFVIPLNFPAHL